MVRVRVSGDLRNIRRDFQRALPIARLAVASQAHADMNQYAPLKEGNLRLQSQVSNDGSTVIYNAPYAARMFYNQFTNYTTPGTGPRWDLKAEGIHRQSWIRVAERAFRL